MVRLSTKRPLNATEFSKSSTGSNEAFAARAVGDMFVASGYAEGAAALKRLASRSEICKG